MRYSPLYIAVLVLISISTLATAQLCFNYSADSPNVTQCQAAPFHTYVNIIDDANCNFTFCNVQNFTSVPIHEMYNGYSRDLDGVIKPPRFVEVMRYRYSNCTSLMFIEYFEIDVCSYQGLGTCDQDNARVRNYRDGFPGCDATPYTDTTYPLGQCVPSGSTYGIARCGTYEGSTNPTAPTNPATTPASPTTPTTTSESFVLSHPQFTALFIFAVMSLM